MALTKADIDRMILHEAATFERVAMIARIERKRAQRARTLQRRTARAVKYWETGRA